MLDINLIRENPELIRDSLNKRQLDSSVVDQLLEQDKERRRILLATENLKADRNRVSKEISRTQDSAIRQTKIDAMRAVGDQIAELETNLRQIESDLSALMDEVPNIPDPLTPYGVDESENPILKTVGDLPVYDFDPLPHWELGVNLGILNLEQGAKITGSRFYVLSGAGARLQRALIAWMLDLHIQQGYTEKYLPFMVKEETLFGAGQLPKFRDNLYKDHEDDLWMVPTAEVPLTGLHMNEILDESALPINYTAYTPCFRREKMSAGRDVRGIKRGHQFDKVEMYTFTEPEDSNQAFDKMVADAEETLSLLGLTYRVIQLCTGDLGFNAQITYDIEVWSPGCGEWLEVSSISNVGDFQARRAKIRYQPKNAKGTRHVHTLNGSGLGLPRTLIAILENYQRQDGSVKVPDVLAPWMGGIEVVQPE